MLKSQVIILIVAIIAVIVIFNLPKHIVKDGRQGEKQSVSAKEEPVKDQGHESSIPESEANKAKELTKKYLSVSDKEKKVKFADSLVGFYRGFQRFDSAAKYLAEIALIKPVKENFIKAGDAYFEASTFSMDEAKRNVLSDAAREQFNKVLKIEPDNLDAKAKIAKTYIGTDQTMMGIRQLKEVLEKNPQHEEALFALGTASIQTKQYGKAVERFEALLKSKPDHIEGNFWLGYSYLELGEKEKAKETFLKVKSLTNDPQILTTVDNYLKEIK